jgi:hypothetical protein
MVPRACAHGANAIDEADARESSRGHPAQGTNAAAVRIRRAGSMRDVYCDRLAASDEAGAGSSRRKTLFDARLKIRFGVRRRTRQLDPAQEYIPVRPG